ncbi:MAG: hypothetical protein BGO29_05120 [Bacteroidales bacterium 36-12]|nr:MAG: hypothetical protein BGO29_05120 [Bacteroidales bacterium 36-12]
MIGTIVNTAAVVGGATIGIFLKKAMPERIKSIYFQVIGLFTIAIGISMVWELKHILIVVVSLAIGSLSGEAIDLEKSADKLGSYLKQKLKIGSEKFNEGLITSFLLFCVGSMTILGAIQEGTGVSSDLLLTKSLMDFFSAIILASAFGIGVAVSALPLFIFQGLLTLLAMLIAPFFTTDIIHGLTNIGGILLIGLGINILEIKKIRIMNMLPSLLFVVILIWIFA